MKIRSFLKSHEDWILALCAALLLFVIILFFSWGITFLAKNVGDALETPSRSSGGIEFDTGAAGRLDLRGGSNF
ncbi:MAG: hypothetical protein AAB495_01325 [Patescibacteria group bacterium]